jgi:signal transduction histidine kinase
VYATARDITDRKRAEEQRRVYSARLEELVEERSRQLRDAQRMSAIGETTTMVGHDLRNPLQAIVNNLYLVRKKLETSEFAERREVEEKLGVIGEEIGYMNKIVLDLQDFASPIQPKVCATDMAKLVRDVLRSSGIPSSIGVKVVGGDLPPLTVDPGRL